MISNVFMCFGLVMLPTIKLVELWGQARPPYSYRLIAVTLLQLIILIGSAVRYISSWHPALLVVLILINLAWLCYPVVEKHLRYRYLHRQYDAEVARCEALVRDDPENAACRSALADAYLAQQRYDDARRELHAVIAKLPEHSREERAKLQMIARLDASRERRR